ncbi:MAG: pyridoxamine 5'-phosphate oxidase family protein [Luteimonas sp.]|nr:pyridoxamine 5'-phosphate oxidase family protein [Luteimonas sp.]
MSHAFANIAFTTSVKAAQQRDGSRAGYARHFEDGGELRNDRLGATEAEFVAAQRSFYMATVSETGWPYVQHRGGPPGFLKGWDDRTLAFADYSGNRQMISVGNVAVNDRVALILVDYAHGTRLKILGHLRVDDFVAADPRHSQLLSAGYKARPQRVMQLQVVGFDWNCPQHIPVRYEAEDVERSIAERDRRIAELEQRLAQAS